MEITFRGWSREVSPHRRTVIPVHLHGNKYVCGKSGEAVEWISGTRALGRVNNLGLTGDFRLYLDYQPLELRNWLCRYVAEEPEAAIRFLGEMQAEAAIRLANKAKSDAVADISKSAIG